MESTMSDNANISIHPFGDDEVYSLSEFPFAHRIDIDNLETIKTVTKQCLCFSLFALYLAVYDDFIHKYLFDLI